MKSPGGSIEHDVLSVEPWEAIMKCSDFTPNAHRSVSRPAPERLLALNEAPTIPDCTL